MVVTFYPPILIWNYSYYNLLFWCIKKWKKNYITNLKKHGPSYNNAGRKMGGLGYSPKQEKDKKETSDSNEKKQETQSKDSFVSPSNYASKFKFISFQKGGSLEMKPEENDTPEDWTQKQENSTISDQVVGNQQKPKRIVFQDEEDVEEMISEENKKEKKEKKQNQEKQNQQQSEEQINPDNEETEQFRVVENEENMSKKKTKKEKKKKKEKKNQEQQQQIEEQINPDNEETEQFRVVENEENMSEKNMKKEKKQKKEKKKEVDVNQNVHLDEGEKKANKRKAGEEVDERKKKK